jgi:hypothetical protein
LRRDSREALRDNRQIGYIKLRSSHRQAFNIGPRCALQLLP